MISTARTNADEMFWRTERSASISMSKTRAISSRTFTPAAICSREIRPPQLTYLFRQPACDHARKPCQGLGIGWLCCNHLLIIRNCLLALTSRFVGMAQFQLGSVEIRIKDQFPQILTNGEVRTLHVAVGDTAS